MSLFVLGLLLLGVASAQNDALSVSVKPTPGGGGFGRGPCPAGQITIACTTGIPPSCTCGPSPTPLPSNDFSCFYPKHTTVPVPTPQSTMAHRFSGGVSTGGVCCGAGPIPIDPPFPINPLPIDPFPRPCACFALYKPVCGRDGQTYGNSCEAGCNKVKVACEGRCPCPRPPPPQGCGCGAVFAPVCGRNGRTYSNSCQAGCDGASIECNGGCPCNRPSPPSTPSTPSDINKFLDECVKKGEGASVAAARAACSTVILKCPVAPPLRSAFGAGASSFSKAAPNPADALLEKVLEGACLVEAENACRSRAFDNINSSDCRSLVNSGPAKPGSRECSSVQDAVRIFNGEVNKLCKRK